MNPPHALTLTRGPLRLTLRTDLGGCVTGLWFDGVPLLRSTEPEALQSVRLCGCYPLLPYSNRIGQAHFTWSGKVFRLETNFAPEPHAIHGVGWQRPWRVLEVSADEVLLGYAHAGDAGWPFAFEATQRMRLEDSAVHFELGLTSRADGPVPAGLGWHPYFVKRPRSRISFVARGRWEMGADKLPTERRAHDGLDQDCTGLDVDHCFDGWDGEARLRDEAMDLRIRSDLRQLVVFTQPQRDFVAIEPVSHVNNMLQIAQRTGLDAAGLGLRVLRNGESTHANMRIEMKAPS